MTMTKRLILALVAVCLFGLAPQRNLQPAQASVTTTQAANGATVTRIKVDGFFSTTFLSSGEVRGTLTASQDRVANTSAVDFSWVRPTTTENVFLLVQGAGAIPNSGLTMTSTSVHLAVTTSFPVYDCLINSMTGESSCTVGSPRSFDLTWVKNGLGTTAEKTTRRETFGPVTTKFSGQFVSETADAAGTWDTYSGTDCLSLCSILDTQSTTIIREITVAPSQ
jgi:hypothetical protein